MALLFACVMCLQLLAVPALAASNQDQIWTYLRSKGFSQPAVAGIMGNLEAESKYRPDNLENAANLKCGLTDEAFTALVDDGTVSREEFARSETYGVYSNGTYGYGLAQWTWWSRKEALYDFATEKQTGIGDLIMQLDFLLKEMSEMKGLSDYGEATDVTEACVRFHNIFENSASTAEMISGRVAMAQAVFDQYGNPSVTFPKTQTYQAGRFSDVGKEDWFSDPVADAYALGLMSGVSDSRFDPGGNVTLAQTVALAARIHSIYTTGGASFRQGEPWYQVYLDYARETGILSGELAADDLNREVTRAQFASLFSKALPADGLICINEVAEGAIPDVAAEEAFAPAVYKLYRAGILAGSDSQGTFRPQAAITRAEAAAITARMGDSGARMRVTFSAE